MKVQAPGFGECRNKDERTEFDVASCKVEAIEPAIGTERVNDLTAGIDHGCGVRSVGTEIERFFFRNGEACHCAMPYDSAIGGIEREERVGTTREENQRLRTRLCLDVVRYDGCSKGAERQRNIFELHAPEKFQPPYVLGREGSFLGVEAGTLRVVGIGWPLGETQVRETEQGCEGLQKATGYCKTWHASRIVHAVYELTGLLPARRFPGLGSTWGKSIEDRVEQVWETCVEIGLSQSIDQGNALAAGGNNSRLAQDAEVVRQRGFWAVHFETATGGWTLFVKLADDAKPHFVTQCIKHGGEG